MGRTPAARGKTPAGLRLSADLSLPLDAATGTFGILATKGSGKSNAAVVMAEQMHAAGIPWVAVDPKGDWYGVRSSADGTGPGLPVVVFGGRHGDVGLEPTAGAVLADLVLSQRLTCVIDVSQFTKAETTRFLLAFGRHLFAHADDDGAEPLHLFLEEAHEYLPQVVKGDQAELVNAWQRIVKQGRFKGLGCTLISQRSSVLNKDVLELIDTLIVLRTIGPRSRQSVKDWVADQDVDPSLLASLPGLGDGEAWVWSPGALRILQRIRFDRRRTFDSGATPKVGHKRRAPATLADIDLAAIKKAMAATLERAKDNDPKALRARIARLERELAAERARPAVTAEKVEVPVEVEVRVEVPVLDPALVARIEKALAPAAALLGQAREALAAAPAADKQGPAAAAPRVPAQRPEARPPAPAPAAPSRTVADQDCDGPVLKAGARRILDTLARHHPMRVTRAQLGTLAKFKVTGGTFQTYWGVLKRHGLVAEADGLVWITPDGLAAAGTVPAEPMSTEEVLATWRGALKAGARAMLDVLVQAYPDPVGRDDLADAVGMTATGGTFQTYLGTLRRNGLARVDGQDVTAGDALFLGG